MVKKKILTSVYVSAVLLVAGCGNKNNINNTVKETSSEIYTVSDVNKTDSYVYASVTSVQKQSENSSENNESADMGSVHQSLMTVHLVQFSLWQTQILLSLQYRTYRTYRTI